MALPVVVIELGSQLAVARDLAAGRVFVSDCTLAINMDCEVIVRGVGDEAMMVGARVVFVDPPRGVGLELLDFTQPKRMRLAELVAAVTAAAAPPVEAPIPETLGVLHATTMETATMETTTEIDEELVLADPVPAPPPPLLDRRPASIAPPIFKTPSVAAPSVATPSVATPSAATPSPPEPPADEDDAELFDAPTTYRKVDRGFIRAQPAKPAAEAQPANAPEPVAPPPASDADLDAATMRPQKYAELPLARARANRASSVGELLQRPTVERPPSPVDQEIGAFQLDASGSSLPAADDVSDDAETRDLELLPDPAAEPDADDPVAELSLAEPDDAERRAIPRNVHERLRGLTMAEQIKIAHSPDPQERIALERLYGKNVWEPLLRNPRLTAPEVVRLARMGTMPRVLVEVIVSNGAWIGIPEVRRALLANPRLGNDQIPRVLRAMSKQELKVASTASVYPMAVREAAKRMMRGG